MSLALKIPWIDFVDALGGDGNFACDWTSEMYVASEPGASVTSLSQSDFPVDITTCQFINYLPDTINTIVVVDKPVADMASHYPT